MTDLLIIAVSAAAAALVSYFAYKSHYKPDSDKSAQADALNADLKPYGFAYDLKGDIFYSLKDCPQRGAGYCRLYDELAPAFSMIIDCEPITFKYNGKRWLIELWKGQYGMTCGAEIGIYNTVRDPSGDNPKTGTFYRNISGCEMLHMELALKKGNREIMRRSAVHWWITGFKLGEFCEPQELSAEARIKFPDRGMLRAFVDGLKRAGYTYGEYSVFGHTVRVNFTKPHTPPPKASSVLARSAVQRVNRGHCLAYRTMTSAYDHTLDKLEYIKRSAPLLYSFATSSLPSNLYKDAFAMLSQYADKEED